MPLKATLHRTGFPQYKVSGNPTCWSNAEQAHLGGDVGHVGGHDDERNLYTVLLKGQIAPNGVPTVYCTGKPRMLDHKKNTTSAVM